MQVNNNVCFGNKATRKFLKSLPKSADEMANNLKVLTPFNKNLSGLIDSFEGKGVDRSTKNQLAKIGDFVSILLDKVTKKLNPTNANDAAVIGSVRKSYERLAKLA